MPSIASRRTNLESIDVELKKSYNTTRKRRVVNPHEEEVISGGLSRILMYQRGAKAVGFSTTAKNSYLEVIKESEHGASGNQVTSRRSLSMLGGD